MGTSAYATAGEVAWNEQEISSRQTLQPGAGGGGQSRYYAKPSYQQGVGPGASDGTRDVGRTLPSPRASNTPGIAVYDCGSGQDQSCAMATTGAGPVDIIGGTSVGSPLAAGIFALIAGKVGCRFGDIHTALYALGRAQFDGGAQVFRDVTMGNNTFIDPAGLTITGYSRGPRLRSGDRLGVAGCQQRLAAQLAGLRPVDQHDRAGGCGCGKWGRRYGRSDDDLVAASCCSGLGRLRKKRQ